MSRRVLLSWSGGKDAAWTLHKLQRDASFEVVGLVTTVTEGYERIAMHGIRRDILHAQAKAAGLPVFEARLPQQADNAAYEASFAAALAHARESFPGVEHIAFGDLFLEDVKAYRDAFCARLGWTPVYPLFGQETDALAREMRAGGLRAILCCVDTTQLGGSFSGAEFDASLLSTLPTGVDPCGERGEFHTCVYDGPMFDVPLSLQRGETVLRDGRFAFTELRLAAQ
jgi:uncharacterized protein (TIGR00290 family)